MIYNKMNVIGVDLGGTSIKAGLVSSSGNIIKKCEIPTEAKKGNKTIINNIIFSINKVKHGKVVGIGIGSPGPLDYKKGIIAKSVNIPFKNVPLKKIIEKQFKIKTCVDNDAKCFTLAEAIFGQGRKYENVVGITLGTGIGGGLVINKKIYHGRNNATELGHMTINYNGFYDNCGNIGCLEAHASSKFFINFSNNKKDPFILYKLALKGNKNAIKTFEEMGYYLGISIANIMYAFDPDIIIIGGKISNAWKFFSKAMNKEIKKRYFAKPCPVVKSKLKDAGILGAAALLIKNK